MKTTGKITKIFALVLCFAMLALLAASCGTSNTVVLTYEGDNGKQYTLTEAEYDVLMKQTKYNIFFSYASQYYYMGFNSSSDNAAFWDADAGDNVTLDATVTASVREMAKTIVIEKYLMDKYGLSIDKDAEVKKSYDKFAADIKKEAKNLGGNGVFKRYWGYTTDEAINYNKLELSSGMVQKHLYDDEKGISKLTEEQLNDYYTENYKQYLLILINTEENIKTDKDGNKLVTVTDKDKKEVTITLKDALDKDYLEENEYTLSYSFEYEAITGDDKKAEIEKKKDLADTILQKLKDHGEDEDNSYFKELALQYSEEFLTYLYEDGYMVSGDLISDEEAKKAIDKLEKAGDMTDVVSVSSGKYLYIVKRIELAEKAYKHAEKDAKDTTYAEIFTTFRETVKSHEYSEFIEEHAKNIKENTTVLDKYNMKNTFLSKQIYYYFG